MNQHDLTQKHQKKAMQLFTNLALYSMVERIFMDYSKGLISFEEMATKIDEIKNTAELSKETC